MAEPLTITAAAPLLRTGELTPSELLEQCLSRIDIYEPAVKAWVYLDRERAQQDAAKATDEIKSNNYRGPLHGIPIGIKDIIDVFDMPTGCGSKLWANSYARRDATCVERLRQAGAIILGKTVTTPYAFTDPPITRNPWNLERTPGGSSSGSAAAVACGMCLAALGTQTGGSTIRPASYCGVCSLKPTHGRISVRGVLPLAPTLDHVGVMANCVRDLAIVFEAIAGPDDLDPECWYITLGPCVSTVDETTGLERGLLQMSFLSGFLDGRIAPEVARIVTEFRDRLKPTDGAGVFVQDIVPPPGFPQIFIDHLSVMAVEAATVHRDRIARLPDDYPPRIAELIRRGLTTDAPTYQAALQFQEEMERNYWRAAKPEPFVTPATTTLPPLADTTGDPSANSPWSFLGYPAISVPVGWSADGLPVAVQLIGGRLGDPELFAHAAWCELSAQFPRRLPPVPIV